MLVTFVRIRSIRINGYLTYPAEPGRNGMTCQDELKSGLAYQFALVWSIRLEKGYFYRITFVWNYMYQVGSEKVSGLCDDTSCWTGKQGLTGGSETCVKWWMWEVFFEECLKNESIWRIRWKMTPVPSMWHDSRSSYYSWHCQDGMKSVGYYWKHVSQIKLEVSYYMK